MQNSYLKHCLLLVSFPQIEYEGMDTGGYEDESQSRKRKDPDFKVSLKRGKIFNEERSHRKSLFFYYSG